jgi:hypothetical protein
MFRFLVPLFVLVGFVCVGGNLSEFGKCRPEKPVLRFGKN